MVWFGLLVSLLFSPPFDPGQLLPKQLMIGIGDPGQTLSRIGEKYEKSLS